MFGFASCHGFSVVCCRGEVVLFGGWGKAPVVLGNSKKGEFIRIKNWFGNDGLLKKEMARLHETSSSSGPLSRFEQVVAPELTPRIWVQGTNSHQILYTRVEVSR